MALSSDVIERLPHVEGILNYLAPLADKPMNLAYDPPPGVARATGVPEPHRMTIYDARPIAARLSLDGEGLAVVEHKSAVKDFYDEDELHRVYYAEAQRLVAEVTGANRVLVFEPYDPPARLGRRRSGARDASPAVHQRPQRLYGEIRSPTGPRPDGRRGRRAALPSV